MKKLLLALFSLIFLLLIGLVVGPSLVDWNKYKDQIITQAEKASGYDINIDGDLSLSLLPAPTLKIEQLSVVAPTKIKFENLLEMKKAEVSIALMPLLQKTVAVEKVVLVEPIINAEMFKNGVGSWMNSKMAAAASLTKMAGEPGEKIAKRAASQALDSIALNNVVIENGALTFIDHGKDVTHQVSDINTSLNARTLNGPYRLKGKLAYNKNPIEMNVEVGAFDPSVDTLTIKGDLSLPEEKLALNYNGLVAYKAPFDVQGQTKISLEKGVGFINEKLSLEGLLTANEEKIELNDLIAFIGDARGTGKLSVANFKEKNPVNIVADLNFSQGIDLGSLEKSGVQNDKTQAQESSSSATSSSEKELIPSSLTLPMSVNAKININAPSLAFGGKNYKGFSVAVTKEGKKTTINGKVLEAPGDSRIEARMDAGFGSSSVSSKTGAVTYSDPTVSFTAEGAVGDIAKALKLYAPKVNAKTAQLFKKAQFDLKGSVSPSSVSLKDSVVKLDETSIGVGGRYTPSSSGRDKAVIDLSVGDINLDQLTGNKPANNNQAQSGSTGSGQKSAGLEKTLEPVRSFSLPLDLVFDLSLQSVVTNGVTIKGVRLTGESAGDNLTLKNASINDYQGAALSAQGSVGSLKSLSGLDIDLGLKTKDIQGFAKAMKVDASKLPSTLKAVDASASLKGAIDVLDVDTKIKAMAGQLDVAGKVTNALATPQFDQMRVGLKHPNLAQAIQLVSPDFKGGAGLSQAVNLSTNVSSIGKVITLSDVKATLGTSNFSGSLKIDQSGSKPSVSGNLKSGTLALDQLLGAKSSSNSKSSGGSSPSASSNTKERWSKAPINVDWMNAVNVDLGLSANAINYGRWSFLNPNTTLKIQDGSLNVKDLKVGLFGGQATLNTAVKAPKQSGGALSLAVDSIMSGISLEALARALSNSNKLQSAGTVAFNFDVTANGNSAHALINALNGKAALDGKDIIIKGFDLNKMARGLAVEDKLADSVSSLLQGSLQGGQTQFDTIKGDYKVEKGVVRINSMAMDSDVSKIESTGFANLPEWTINTDHTITLKDITDLDPFTVKIKGPLDNPVNTFGTNVLEDYLGAKIKRKLAKELSDVLGSDVSNTLEQLGILPQQQKAAPSQQAPANQNVAPAQKQEAPKKIEKPEDALKEFLNSDNPEDAVGNVLRGLF
ncbi:MAG: AsmA family protein [Pseudomonadota bacterium]